MPALPSYTIEEIPGLVNDPDFQAAPADVRARAMEHALGTSFDAARAAGELSSPQDMADFREAARLAHERAGASFGEKAWGAVKGGLGGIVEMAKGLPGQLVVMGEAAKPLLAPGQGDLNLTKEYGRAMAGQAAQLAAVPINDPMGLKASNLSVLQKEIDTGAVPLNDPAKLNEWADNWSKMVPHLDTPEGADLLHRYIRTGSPEAWGQLGTLVTRGDLSKWGQKQVSGAAGSAAVKSLPAYLQEQFPAAADPVNVAMLAAPMLRGAKAAQAVTGGGRIGQIAASAGEGALIGAGMHLRDDPNAGLEDTAMAAAQMGVMTAGMAGGTAALGAGVNRLAGRAEQARVPTEAVPADAGIVNEPSWLARGLRPINPLSVEYGLAEVPVMAGDVVRDFNLETKAPKPMKVRGEVDTISTSERAGVPTLPSEIQGNGVLQPEIQTSPSAVEIASVNTEASQVRIPEVSAEAPVVPTTDAGSTPATGGIDPVPAEITGSVSQSPELARGEGGLSNTAQPSIPAPADRTQATSESQTTDSTESGGTATGQGQSSSFEYPKVPAGSQAPYEGPTSIRNATVDAERVARGLEPMMAPARREWGTAWDEATARLDQNATAGHDLVRELNDKPRTLSDTDNALLLQHKLAVRWQVDSAVDRLNDPGVDEATKATARVDLARHLDELDAIDNAGKAAGTETGRGLNARKMMAGDDEWFSLPVMLAREQARKGEPLSEPEMKTVTADHAKIETTRRKLADHVEATEERKAAHAVQTMLDDHAAKLKADAEAALTAIKAKEAEPYKLKVKPKDGLPDRVDGVEEDLVDWLRNRPLKRAKGKAGEGDPVRDWARDDKRTHDALTADDGRAVDKVAQDAFRYGNLGLADDGVETFMERLRSDIEARRRSGKEMAARERDIAQQERAAVKEGQTEEADQKAFIKAKLTEGVPMGEALKQWFARVRENAARDLEQQRRDEAGRVSMNPIGSVFRTTMNHVKIGAAYIAEGVIDFAQWSARVLADFPHLVDVGETKLRDWFERSKLYHDGTKEEFTARVEAEARARTPQGILENFETEAFNRGEAPARLDPGLVRDLVVAHVSAGVKTLKELVAAVHKDVTQLFPDVTPREVRDAFSSYGKQRKPSADQIKKDIAELKAQARLASAYEDATVGRAPLKSGLQRPKPSDKVREMGRAVKEMMRKMGIETTREGQLTDARQAIITRLQNQVRDLNEELRGRAKVGPKRDPVVYDKEMNKLAADVKELRAYLDDLTGPNPEVKWNRKAEKAAQISAENYRRRAAQGDLSKQRAPGFAKGDRLKAAEAERAAAKGEWDALRESAGLPQAEALEGVKNGMVRRMAEIRRILDGGAKPAQRKPVVLDAEGRALKAELGRLNQQLKEFEGRTGKRGMTDTQRAEAAEKIAQKHIDAIEKELATGQREVRPDVPEYFKPAKLRALEAELESLRGIRDAAREAKVPRRTAEQIALAKYKSRTAGMLGKLQTKLATGDFSKPKPQEFVMDEKALKLEADYEAAKLEYRRRQMQRELDARPRARYWADVAVKWQRGFLLSGLKTLGKLGMAAVYRLASTPVEEAIGAGIGQVPGLRTVARLAPRQGGANMKAETRALSKGFISGVKQFGKVIKTGKTDRDLLHDKVHTYDLDRSVMDYFGQLHAAFKAPVKLAEFERSFEKRMQHAAENGLDGKPVDLSDAAVQMRVAADAYRDAKRSIFMQDNALASMIQRALRGGENDKQTPTSSFVWSKIGQALMPVVRIPTNYVGEAAVHVFGGVTGSAMLARAFIRGIETLKPEEADAIMRHFKKGSVGAGMLAYGFFNPQSVGGYYTDNEKRRPGDVAHGTFKLFGVTVPQVLAHAPFLEAMQFGATMRRVVDHMNTAGRVHRKPQDEVGLTHMVGAAALGLLSEVPAMHTSETVADMMHTDYRGANAWGNFGKSFVIPALLRDTAELSDLGQKRQTKTIGDKFKVDIPGLRQTLPLKKATH